MLKNGISKIASKDREAVNKSIQNRIRKTAPVLHLFRTSDNLIHLSDSPIAKGNSNAAQLLKFLSKHYGINKAVSLNNSH
jgi:hypothetical protein